MSSPPSLKDCSTRTYTGLVLGGTTGLIIGAWDAAKSSTLTKDWRNSLGTKIRDPRIMKFFLRQNLTTAAVCSATFGSYHAARCVLAQRGPKDMDLYSSAALCTAISFVPFFPLRVARRNLIYVLMLVGMDTYTEAMHNSKYK